MTHRFRLWNAQGMLAGARYMWYLHVDRMEIVGEVRCSVEFGAEVKEKRARGFATVRVHHPSIPISCLYKSTFERDCRVGVQSIDDMMRDKCQCH